MLVKLTPVFRASMTGVLLEHIRKKKLQGSHCQIKNDSRPSSSRQTLIVHRRVEPLCLNFSSSAIVHGHLRTTYSITHCEMRCTLQCGIDVLQRSKPVFTLVANN
jgi:hypothetical protein